MSRIIKNKTRISRACGSSLWGAQNDPVHDRNYPAGQHGPNKLRVKKSDYGLQLMEKQKLRKYYGTITEKQFKNTFKKAAKLKGNTSTNFVCALESRLDAIIYRANFAESIFQARQIVSHGHVSVNGKRVKVPSYSVKPGDVVTIRDSAKNHPEILKAVEAAKRAIPEYLQADAKKLEIKYVRLPEDENEVPYNTVMNLHWVVEYYSR